ncbi:hypothetical protein D3C71_1939170 [compost metagenome]
MLGSAIATSSERWRDTAALATDTAASGVPDNMLAASNVAVTRVPGISFLVMVSTRIDSARPSCERSMPRFAATYRSAMS